MVICPEPDHDGLSTLLHLWTVMVHLGLQSPDVDLHVLHQKFSLSFISHSFQLLCDKLLEQ